MARAAATIGTGSRIMGVSAAGLSLLAAGCVFDSRTVEEVRSAPVDSSAAVVGLDIWTRNGSVAVTRSEGDDRGPQSRSTAIGGPILITATLRARTHERLAEMKVVAEQNEAGVLVIRPEPAGQKWLNNEGCSIEISAPGSATEQGLTVKTGNGKITVSGVRGKSDLRSSNGKIIVDDAEGPILADTSNGRIELTDVPGPVDADTSNGPVLVRLTPAGRGPVRIDTSNGGVTLEVGPDFGGTLSARTSNGRVELPDKFENGSRKRRSADIALGPGGGSSVISTSNGNIRVRMIEMD